MTFKRENTKMVDEYAFILKAGRVVADVMCIDASLADPDKT